MEHRWANVCAMSRSRQLEVGPMLGLCFWCISTDGTAGFKICLVIVVKIPAAVNLTSHAWLLQERSEQLSKRSAAGKVQAVVQKVSNLKVISTSEFLRTEG